MNKSPHKYIYLLHIGLLLLLLPQNTIAQKDSTHFVTTWRTSNPGTSDSNSITLATDGRFEYDFDVDWNNDGVFDDHHVKQSISHQYLESGDYSIRIRGKYPRILLKTPFFSQ